VSQASPSALRRPQARGGYAFAYTGLLLFTILLYLRPNEILPIGGFPVVRIVAVVTLASFFIERMMDGRPLPLMPRPFKYLLILGILMVLSIPIGLDPAGSFAGFTDVFLKIVLIFLLTINVVNSFRRLRLLIEVTVLSGTFVAVATLLDFASGKNLAEGFRAAGAVGGIFGNPNDLALAMNVLIPLGIGLVLIRRNPLLKVVYLVCTGLFVATAVATYSRAGFLTLMVAVGFLLVQLGRRYPAAWGVAAVAAGVLFAASPGTFWARVTTIFEGSAGSGVSAAESATTRWELIKRSIEVMGFNPFRWLFGVGIDNFHYVSIYEFGNHNGYLQVFNEVGLPAFIVYLLFLCSVIAITGRVVKQYSRARGYRQVWLTAIAIEGSLVAYAVGSFFASVAYLWYLYYPAAFAVCLQRLLANVELKPTQKEAVSSVWYLRRVQH